MSLHYFKACLNAVIDNEQLLDIEISVSNSTAIVGQSGSGKSLALKIILGLAPKNIQTSLTYDWDYEIILGKTVALVPQNPFTALSPKSKISNNFFCDSMQSSILLESVGLDKSLLNRYPSELSGGQLQRVCIAIALSHKPKLLLMDEPTTALDMHTKMDICKLLKDLSSKNSFLSIFVSHEIDIAAMVCNDVFVLDKGKIAEQNTFANFLAEQKSEIGRVLINSNFKNRNFRE